MKLSQSWKGEKLNIAISIFEEKDSFTFFLPKSQFLKIEKNINFGCSNIVFAD